MVRVGFGVGFLFSVDGGLVHVVGNGTVTISVDNTIFRRLLEYLSPIWTGNPILLSGSQRLPRFRIPILVGGLILSDMLFESGLVHAFHAKDGGHAHHFRFVSFAKGRPCEIGHNRISGGVDDAFGEYGFSSRGSFENDSSDGAEAAVVLIVSVSFFFLSLPSFAIFPIVHNDLHHPRMQQRPNARLPHQTIRHVLKMMGMQTHALVKRPLGRESHPLGPLLHLPAQSGMTFPRAGIAIPSHGLHARFGDGPPEVAGGFHEGDVECAAIVDGRGGGDAFGGQGGGQAGRAAAYDQHVGASHAKGGDDSRGFDDVALEGIDSGGEGGGGGAGLDSLGGVEVSLMGLWFDGGGVVVVFRVDGRGVLLPPSLGLTKDGVVQFGYFDWIVVVGG
mmetsp:Transcript_8630/g.18511  ORF Transcript_8630/g.18511 Transcript_8630/m.18511 type:complete len:390 (-) Transcript_8630:7-1176(-)